MAKKPTDPPHLRVVSDSNKRPTKGAAPKAPAKSAVGQGRTHHPTDQTRSLVSLCKAMGYTEDQTAKTVGIAVNTLKAHYREELDTGDLKANAKVAANLFTMATSPTHPKAVTAAIFWAKSKMGWTDKASETEDPENEEPVEFTIGIGEKRGA
jgi:hypothetical protein